MIPKPRLRKWRALLALAAIVYAGCWLVTGMVGTGQVRQKLAEGPPFELSSRACANAASDTAPPGARRACRVWAYAPFLISADYEIHNGPLGESEGEGEMFGWVFGYTFPLWESYEWVSSRFTGQSRI